MNGETFTGGAYCWTIFSDSVEKLAADVQKEALPLGSAKQKNDSDSSAVKCCHGENKVKWKVETDCYCKKRN